VFQLHRFSTETIRHALERQLGSPPPSLVELACVPLFYEMVRRVQDHWPKLLDAKANRTLLEEEWFKIILQENRYSPRILSRLGAIAGMMLHNRTDLLEANSVDDEVKSLLRGLSEYPFALFVEELKGAYSFSHQSLREFVLAWCVAKEIKTCSFDLLKSSSSFDYEGHEFHDRVRNLIDIKSDVIDQLGHLLDVPTLDERERNNLIRNLFEMLGELTPSDNGLAERIAEAALPYLERAGTKADYITYKTRYNIVRCLERIHWSAPRPYIKHIKDFRWWWNHNCSVPPGVDYISAYVIRGFHRPRQEATSSPPIVYRATRTPASMKGLEVRVSDCLMAVIEGLKEHEVPEDACFLGINSTLALIRWLPQRPDLARIEDLLRHRHIDWRMKQNLFHALFIRYRTEIPDCLRKSGLFRDARELREPSAEAREAFQRLTR
jgi:hypothetical protein